jgi:phospholipase C
MRKRLKLLLRQGVAAATALGLITMQAGFAGADGYKHKPPYHPTYPTDPNEFPTATAIKHLVVIFGENISFDHYYGVYPNAANPAGEPSFTPSAWTPNVNGLNGALLTANPNFLNNANGSGAANPFRLDRSQNLTADQDHDYTAEQQAFDHGLMDAFPEFTGFAGPPPNAPPPAVETTGMVMGYYDGNTVTALWNYAQHYALNDNAYGTNFGPSTDGALNLISGQLNGVLSGVGEDGSVIGDGNGGSTLISDIDPSGDLCSSPSSNLLMAGTNIGDLLNAAGITWGWFEGGFNLSIVNSNNTTGCKRSTTSAITGVNKADYVPHHEPFQYYPSTANPNHLRPTAAIGQTDQANHQYDILDFYSALKAGDLPAVSFLKAIGSQDAHPGYSSPLDEQQFVVTVINAIQQSPFWKDTAIIIQYDDSDGWYDHQMSPIINQSATSADELTDSGACGTGDNALPGIIPATLHAQGRCGYGPRIPISVISPYAKSNFIDHTLLDQTSTLRFIEDNWLASERIGQGSFDALAGSLLNMFDFTKINLAPFVLNPNTGEPLIP